MVVPVSVIADVVGHQHRPGLGDINSFIVIYPGWPALEIPAADQSDQRQHRDQDGDARPMLSNPDAWAATG